MSDALIIFYNGNTRFCLLGGSTEELQDEFKEFHLLPRTNRQFSVRLSSSTNSYLRFCNILLYYKNYLYRSQVIYLGIRVVS